MTLGFPILSFGQSQKTIDSNAIILVPALNDSNYSMLYQNDIVLDKKLDNTIYYIDGIKITPSSNIPITAGTYIIIQGPIHSGTPANIETPTNSKVINEKINRN